MPRRRSELKRVLRRRRDLLRSVLDGLDGGVRVWTADDQLVLEHGPEPTGEPVSIRNEDVVLGRIAGPPAAIALLGHLVTAEIEVQALAEETLDRYKELSFVYDVAEELSRAHDLREVAEVVLDQALRFLRADGGAVLLQTSEGPLRVVSSHGSELEGINAVEPAGIVARVLATGRAELVDDVTEHASFVQLGQPIRSLLCAPLRTGENSHGVLRVTSQQPARWRAGDLRLITSLATHAASAVENARLHRDRLRAQRLRTHVERYVHPLLAIAAEEHDQCAVVLCDLRQLAGLDEDSAPDAVVAGLERSLAQAVGVLLAHGGTVDRLHGDLLVAVFTGPGAGVDAAEAARAVLGRFGGMLGCGVSLRRSLRAAISTAAALQVHCRGRILLDYDPEGGAETGPALHTPEGEVKTYEVRP